MVAPVIRRAVLPLTAPVGSVRSVRWDGVVLTYDDGPQPGGTDRVLAALAEFGTTATFFILVGRARKRPGLLREVIAAGHEIALHGIDHVRLTSLSPGVVRRRTRDGRRELEDLSGQPVRWFRPPYGSQRVSTWAAVRSTGLESVVWSNDVADWQDDPVDEIAGRSATTVSGSVLLMHDGYADAFDGVDDGPEPRFDRGELSRRVLGSLRERGLATSSLRDALAGGSAVRGAWFRN
ncbi:MAG TPA: polysaccharide deacetylase family protein [Pseudonocardiaceae bacterium]|jgi:peptidoglycan/xylan/chitin deacetylase (PgdA/CDA1 family)|nr:polysaccharide deacetylase family protein [Pseudonocardiaceae bacterium]